MAKVSPCPNTGCWWWTGSTDAQGYARFRGQVDGKLDTRAHRVAFQLFKGSTGGELVLHRCNSGHLGCVNPAHLYLGTDADNARDRSAVGRSTVGERNPGAKITAAVAEAIRGLAAQGVNGLQISKRIGISSTQTYRILRGDYWKAA